MPVSDDDLAHLLRRTEFVVRPARLAYLKTLPTLAEVVEDIIDIGLNGNPPLPVEFQSEGGGRLGPVRLTPARSGSTP